MSACAVWLVSRGLQSEFRHYVSPFLVDLEAGPKLLVGHIVVYSFVPAVICGSWWHFLVGRHLVAAANLRKNIHQTLKQGLVTGTCLALATLVSMPPLYGLEMQFHANPWSIVGNAFSNTYEEIVYRGLIFTSVQSCTGSPWAGIMVSGLAFGYVHDDYPLGVRLAVGITGGILAWIYSRTGNFVGPVWAHDIADWIVDLFI